MGAIVRLVLRADGGVRPKKKMYGGGMVGVL